MFIYTLKFDRKKAVFAVIMAALVLIGIILLIGAFDGKANAAENTSPKKTVTNVKTEKNRVAYLAQYGWQAETPAQSADTVVIPQTFSQVFEEYNALQQKQGFDLSQYCGMEVQLYTYRILNPEYADDEVLASLYVCGSEVVGGDVHSTAMDGFIRRLR